MRDTLIFFSDFPPLKQQTSDEMSLMCEEKGAELSSDCDSQESSPKNHIFAMPLGSLPAQQSTLSASLNAARVLPSQSDQNPEINGPTKFRQGDLVWVELPGYPSWPGKIVSHEEARKPTPDNGKVGCTSFTC